MFTPGLYQDHRKLRLFTPLGVDDVGCDGTVVSGHFKASLHEFAGEKDGRLVERFANWPDDVESIVSFTRQYGPLHGAAKESCKFAFLLEEFRESQVYFRDLWKRPERLAQLELPDGKLRFVGGTVTYAATDLFKYLQCDLLTNAPERIRICRRDGCAHPYFIAAHLKKQFCGPECQEEGHRSAKRDWWQRRGQEWLQSRKEKGGSNGTDKTR
jgi:hypothetical protein